MASASLIWTQRQDIGPTARAFHAVAYDAQAERMLLFGGDTAGGATGDTWSWNGETWTQLQDIGPAPRAAHAMAYDSGRERTTLFGGLGAQPFADTWEWDGEAWTQVADTGPSARSNLGLAFDSVRSRLVLFGGEDSTGALLGDTWEWDGEEWTQVADTGPSPRARHALSFEPPAPRTILFGGVAASDTWAWDGTTWTMLNDVGPSPRGDARLAFTGHSTVLFGGRALPTDVFGSTWELDDSDWTERQNMGPAPRYAHALTLDTARNRIVLFGGLDEGDARIGDTWELPVAGAVEPEPGVPGLGLLTFTPNPVVRGAQVQVTVELLQPASATVNITVVLLPSTFLANLSIPAGQTSMVTNATTPVAIQPGPHQVVASTGDQETRAPLILI